MVRRLETARGNCRPILATLYSTFVRFSQRAPIFHSPFERREITVALARVYCACARLLLLRSPLLSSIFATYSLAARRTRTQSLRGSNLSTRLSSESSQGPLRFSGVLNAPRGPQGPRTPRLSDFVPAERKTRVTILFCLSRLFFVRAREKEGAKRVGLHLRVGLSTPPPAADPLAWWSGRFRSRGRAKHALRSDRA